MKHYKYLLFDLDGTLTDSQNGIKNTFRYTLEKFDIKIDDDKDLRPFLGPPLSYTFPKLLGFSEEDTELAIKYYREYYNEKGKFDNIVYDGIPELLEKLNKAGYKLILATSKPETVAVQILEHFDLLKYFLFAAGASFDASREAKHDVIIYALNSCNITDLNEVVMIGDTKHDITGAKNASAAFSSEAKLASIGVLYGYGIREELEAEGADYIVETVGELGKLLLN